MPFDFDRPIDRRHSDSTKWRSYDADVLPLWTADMDFAVPPPVIEALHARVAHGVFGYCYEPPELRAVIVERLASECGVERVNVDDRLITAMREEAAEAGADGRTVIETDAAGPGSPDWPLLVTLVKGAVERLERTLARPEGTLLLEQAGLLARYGLLGLLERLRDRLIA
jgi:aspartate/methionine/tyrosine aminotransferase